MTNKTIFTLLLSICLIPCLFCKKSNSNTCQWAAEPPVFVFQIKKNGQVLPDSVLNNLKVNYSINGNKMSISDVSLAVGPYANRGILTSRIIGTFENQAFYLEYSNGFPADTLLVENLLPSPSTNCEYAVKEIRFNGQIVQGDTSFGYQPVYILNKQ